MLPYVKQISEAVDSFDGIQGPKRLKDRHRLKTLLYHDAYRIDPNVRPTDKKLYKYWKNRTTIFKCINEGNIYLTDELWFSVTPENLAQFTGNFIRHCLPHARCIVDVFCGGGGNTVQFAKLFEISCGIDFNVDHLYCAYRNAESFKAAGHLKLMLGDWKHLTSKKILRQKLGMYPDCVFASPPWGGVDYLKKDKYDLEQYLRPEGLTRILSVFLKVSQNIVLFLPRNSNLDQLSDVTRDLLGEDAKCKVVYVRDNGYMKGMLVFWGKPFYDFADSCEQIEDKTTDLNEEHEHAAKKPKLSNIDIKELY